MESKPSPRPDVARDLSCSSANLAPRRGCRPKGNAKSRSAHSRRCWHLTVFRCKMRLFGLHQDMLSSASCAYALRSGERASSNVIQPPNCSARAHLASFHDIEALCHAHLLTPLETTPNIADPIRRTLIDVRATRQTLFSREKVAVNCSFHRHFYCLLAHLALGFAFGNFSLARGLCSRTCASK